MDAVFETLVDAAYFKYDNNKLIEEVEMVENLRVVSSNIFVKYKGDAFSNPELDAFSLNLSHAM